MPPIFPDDSSVEDRRDAAIDRLLSLCPAPFRLTFRDSVVKTIDNVPPDELARLMASIDELQVIAATGDVERLADRSKELARSFGVDDKQMEQIQSFATMFVTVPQS